jgi:hypothetical protein
MAIEYAIMFEWGGPSLVSCIAALPYRGLGRRMGNQWAQRVLRVRFGLEQRSHESRFVAGGLEISGRIREWQGNAEWDVGNLYFSSSRDASSGDRHDRVPAKTCHFP